MHITTRIKVKVKAFAFLKQHFTIDFEDGAEAAYVFAALKRAGESVELHQERSSWERIEVSENG